MHEYGLANFDEQTLAIVEYVEKLKPEMTILVHGDQPAIDWMQQELQARVPETQAIIATPGREIHIG